MIDRIYFDNAATTPCDPRVVEAMLPYWTERFGNPASRTHPFGWEAEEAVEIAREQVASLVNARPREIVFTSGATESNNLVLKGVFLAGGVPGGHLLTTAIEHSAVLEPGQRLERLGVEVTRLLPDETGAITPEAVEGAIRSDTRLVSVMHANNETGTLQDIAAIARLCARRGVLFHTDATQSAGKVPIDVQAAGIDFLSCSAHKIHGPKGTGALFVRRRGKLVLQPLLEGGGQERGLRAGTVNVPGVIGFGAACAIALSSREEEAARISNLRDRLERGILEQVPRSRSNVPSQPRAPGIANLHFEGIEGESLMHALPGVAFSGGSACASASLEPSHVLLALGLSPEVARNSFRFSLGRFNTAAEADSVIQLVTQAVERLRRSRAPGAVVP